ncbi:MAG TPA: segregation/condensation protein A [Acetobacteraceae bacterium]
MPDHDGAVASSAVAAPRLPASPAGPHADNRLWDDWDQPPRAPAIPVLHLDGFDGPMDLLLDLAERQRIDLGRISILALVEQFVAAMDRLAGVPVERRADWVVVATRLVLLRSKLLFPASPEAAAEAARAAASEIERLDSLRFVRAAAAWLQGRPQLGHDVFARPRGPDPRAASYMALLEACLTVLRGREGETDGAAIYRPPIPDLFRVPGALVRIRAKLAGIARAELLDAFLPLMPRTTANRELLARSAVASTFMAALELARRAELALSQDAAFRAIVVTPVVPAGGFPSANVGGPFAASARAPEPVAQAHG